ncbi:tryptophan-rich sensory protein [Patescibacteria group bacterium]|nr:tryptophan-rich sensory protein [Patescibacteria group bacterium]
MNNIITKILVTFSYLAMIIVNFLANFLPINNRDTGQISDSYANLFAPTGLTFSIWGLIYLLLGIYVLYQLGVFKKIKIKEDLLKKIGLYFIISSVANISWILSWHYDIIYLSVLFMAIILFSLIKIITMLNQEKLSKKEYLFMRLPFSLYFGWITVASIANITVLLVSLNWEGFGVAPEIWTMSILFIGAIIGILTIMKNQDIAYGLVFTWAYVGILIKHTSPSGFGNQYPGIIFSTLFCIGSFLFFVGYLISKKKLLKNSLKFKKTKIKK